MCQDSHKWQIGARVVQLYLSPRHPLKWSTHLIFTLLSRNYVLPLLIDDCLIFAIFELSLIFEVIIINVERFTKASLVDLRWLHCIYCNGTTSLYAWCYG